MEKDDPKAQKYRPFGDGFHTSSPGGMLMAHAILTGLHAPALVSDVAIDLGSKKADAKGCKVAQLEAGVDDLSFVRTDDALPLPVQKDWAPILPYMNELKDLNWYGLKVTGLPDGKYQLRIDGKTVAEYTAKDLAAGVNLGNLTEGPVWEHGNKVFTSINLKNALVKARFQGVIRFQAPDWLADVVAERRPAELKKRLDQINEMQDAIYKMVQPKALKFELKKS